jgi:hypothetical protein
LEFWQQNFLSPDHPIRGTLYSVLVYYGNQLTRKKMSQQISHLRPIDDLGGINAVPNSQSGKYQKEKDDSSEGYKSKDDVTYAPISGKKQPSIVYDPPVMNEVKKTTLPQVDMNKYNQISVNPKKDSDYHDDGGYQVGMEQYYKDIARNRPTVNQFGFRLPKLKRNRKRIYVY